MSIMTALETNYKILGAFMNLLRLTTSILLFSLLPMLQACGGGASNNTNGSVAVAVDKTSVGTGSTFTATVTFTTPITTALNGLQVSLLSDDTAVIPNSSGYTNDKGIANIILQPRSVITTQKTINLIAVVEGLRSRSIPVTVTPPILTLSPPADAEFAAVGSVNQTVRFVAQNLKVTFKDSLGNPVQNQGITLSVDTINNQKTGDQVIFFPTAGNQVIAPPGTITVMTDSSGEAIIPVSIDVVTPSSAPSQHVITIIWKASVDALGYNNTPLAFTASGSTQLTVTN